MDNLGNQIKLRNNPEHKFTELLKKFLREKGWFVHHMPSSMYSMGWPDLFLLHPQLKCNKFVEVKSRVGKLRETQIKLFSQMHSSGVNVYVLEGDDKTTVLDISKTVYSVLFGPPNWSFYIRGVR